MSVETRDAKPITAREWIWAREVSREIQGCKNAESNCASSSFRPFFGQPTCASGITQKAFFTRRLPQKRLGPFSQKRMLGRISKSGPEALGGGNFKSDPRAYHFASERNRAATERLSTPVYHIADFAEIAMWTRSVALASGYPSASGVVHDTPSPIRGGAAGGRRPSRRGRQGIHIGPQQRRNRETGNAAS